MTELWLIRHGETEWSRSGAHTGRTDLPLTEAGRTRAAALGQYLKGHNFGLVLTSPLQRAVETCRLAGLGEHAQIEPDLREWDYGDYEGRSTEDIRRQRPDWSLWTDGVPNGETIERVAERARAVIERALESAERKVALFAHGHILRILGACWMGLAPIDARLLGLTTASVSTLGHERETRVITLWNLVPEGCG
ncbi:MAG: histidine phosphatase family protein [Acidobacteriia bacterium]|nr:histidine phosphatase family protein [Terriglobia bacterium]